MSEEIIVVEKNELRSPDYGDKRPSNRKDMIKNIAIGFLSVMLVLTFFSNTIMNYSLPQVSTRQITSGSISPQVRGTGTVSAEDPYNVTVKETRKISGVAVKEGAHVEIGDVLYYLEDKESTELTDARDKLDELELAFEQSLFSGDVPSEVISRVRNGKTTTFDSYQSKVGSVLDTYDAAVKALADAEAAVTYLGTSKTVDTGDATLEKYGAEYSKEDANLELQDAKRKLEESSEALIDIEVQYEAIRNIVELEAKLESLSESDPEYEIVVQDFTNSFQKYTDRYGLCYNIQTEYDIVRANRINLYSQTDAYESRIRDIQHVIDNDSREISHLGTYVNQLGTTYEQKLAKAEQIKTDAEAALKVATEEKEKSLKSINTEISLVNQRDRITKQKEKIAKLEAESVGASVKAPVKGIVSSLSKVAGESVSADETIAVIQVDGKDMTTNFSVTNAQAQKLKVGDDARPQNVWQFGDDFKATLTSIKNDKTDPANKKLLTFKIESKDVTPGQTISLTIGERSVDYDYVVPNSAIKTDTNGKFILVVTSKSSPLGNRYMASRVDVDVKAQDDNNSAIAASLDGDEYVITTATTMVKAGDQVRLVEQ